MIVKTAARVGPDMVVSLKRMRARARRPMTAALSRAPPAPTISVKSWMRRDAWVWRARNPRTESAGPSAVIAATTNSRMQRSRSRNTFVSYA